VPSLEFADPAGSFRLEKRRFLFEAHCRASQPICQAKKARNRMERFSTQSSIALRGIPVQKWVIGHLRTMLFHPKFTLCGLSGQSDLHPGIDDHRHA
jgi:hypothetical protein